MISLSGVTKVFSGRSGSVTALDGIDLTVGATEFVTLIGRSGCGKSTLLRLVSGLLQPSSGSVLVDGVPVTGPRRDVSFMFQQPALLPWRSVLQNVLLPIEIFGLDRRSYVGRAHDLLDLVGMRVFEKRLPRELSGGMRQRVSLCRSLIQSPTVMLMDEPFSALDALTRTELSEELQRVHHELETTILFVTHSIDEAVLLADRVVILSPHPGRVHSIVDVSVPRPRVPGVEVAKAAGELHELFRGVRS